MQFNIEEYGEKKKLNYMKVLIVLIFAILAVVIGIIIAIFINSNNKEVAEVAITNETIENQPLNVKTAKLLNAFQEEQKKMVRKPNMTQENIQKIKDIYKQGNANHKVAYLTFDDGPSKTITPQILDTLKKYNVKVTFFVLGTNVDNYPELVQREYKEGHYIANHGYTHQYAKIYAKPENVLDEYNTTEEKIRKALGDNDYKSGLFRFPGGSHGGTYANVKKQAIEILKENNVAYLDWNSLTSDAVAGTDKQQMIKDLKDTVSGNNSVVVLMHDAANKQDTADLLPQVIEYLRDEGYEFKNIYDIMNDTI